MNRRQRRKRIKRLIREHVPYAFRDYTPAPSDPTIVAAFAAGMREGYAKRNALLSTITDARSRF